MPRGDGVKFAQTYRHLLLPGLVLSQAYSACSSIWRNLKKINPISIHIFLHPFCVGNTILSSNCSKVTPATLHWNK